MRKSVIFTDPLWLILLALLFVRPFICESAFPFSGLWYDFFLVVFSFLYICFNWVKIKFRPSLLDYSALLFFIIILWSIIFSKSPRQKGEELLLWAPNIALFIAAGQLENGRRKQLLKVIFVSALVVCLYTVYQYYFGFRHLEAYINSNPADLPYPPEYLKMILARKRPFSTFLSPNVFSSYLLMMIFVGAGLFVQARKRISSRYGRIESRVILAGLAILILTLFFAKALSALAAFLAGLLAFIFIGIKYSRNIPKKDARRMVIFFGYIFVSLAVVAFVFARHRIFQVVSSPGENNSLEQRWYYWLSALKMIKEHFLFGIGWGNFEVYYNFYRCPLANYSRYAHNFILQIFAETGVLGLLSLLGLVGIFIKNGFAAITRRQDEYWFTVSLFIAGLVFLFHNLFDISFYFGQSALFWWIIIGMFSRKEKALV